MIRIDDLDDDELVVNGQPQAKSIEVQQPERQPETPTEWWQHEDPYCQLCATSGPLANHHMHKIAQHSSRSQEHYTPTPIVESTRKVLGGTIDLDPASCSLAQQIIGAKKWYGWDGVTMHDGLALSWDVQGGTAFCNPPGGLTAKARPDLTHVHKSYPMLWWGRFSAEFMRGSFSAGIWVCFTLEQLRLSQAPLFPGMPAHLDFPVCYLAKRLRFDYPSQSYQGRPQPAAHRETGQSPTHANAIVYLGPEVRAFADEFAQWGQVVIPSPRE